MYSPSIGTDKAQRKRFEIVSPSYTGLGLEVLRNAPIIRGALRKGWLPRLWTFHPSAFNDSHIDIIPLQEGWEPVVPAFVDQSRGHGVVWLPHGRQHGPYVCIRSFREGVSQGFRILDDSQVSRRKPGAYPVFVADTTARLLGNDGAVGDDIDPLQAGETHSLNPEVVLNLVGAHGTEKGLRSTADTCGVADRLAGRYGAKSWMVLLNSRVCAGQSLAEVRPNIRTLTHTDSDIRIARRISRLGKVITVEGGLAHFAVQRGAVPLVVGLRHWLDETAYLYPDDGRIVRCDVDALDVDTLVTTLGGILDTWLFEK